MSKFRFKDLNEPKNGSKLPLSKEIKRWFFNLKTNLTRNSEEEMESVRHISRGLK